MAEFCDGVDNDSLVAAVQSAESAAVQASLRKRPPAQQLTELYDKVQDLGEELEIRKIRERKQLRETIRKQLPQKYLEIDRRYTQSRVLT